MYLDVVGGDEPGLGCVAQGACLAGGVVRVSGFEVAGVVGFAPGSLAVEDVGPDSAFLGCRGGVGEDLLRRGEGQVGEPGEGAGQAGLPLPVPVPGVLCPDMLG
jgi:hypothetical protein